MNKQERLNDILSHASGRGDRSGAKPGASEQREENLRRLVRAAMPAAEVSDALRQRVRSLETAPVQPTRPWLLRLFPQRARWALGAALLLAGVVAPIVQPRWVAAQALRRMESAITDVHSAHDVSWRVAPDGTRTKVGESWWQGGKCRAEGSRPSDRTLVFTDGKVWHYDASKHTVTVWGAEGPFGYNRSGFSLTAMARDFARWGWRDNIRVQGEARLGGRRVRIVIIQRADEPNRSLLFVDAATDLPVRREGQRRVDGRWVTEMVTEHEYNRPLPASLFVPRFPASARLIDMVSGRANWEQRLLKGIARQRAGERIIVLRDLQVNAQGDIFLLYTAGRPPDMKSGEDWEIEIKDDRGTEYRNGQHYQPHMRGNPSPAGDGYVFDGERLEGNWWIPRAPQDPWGPRRFTITFHVARTAPSADWELAGGPDGILLPRDKQFPVKAIFTLDVERPTTALVPEWMPYMAVGLDEREIERGQISTRTIMHRLDRDYERALAGYQELARKNEERAKELGEPIADPQLWTDMGELLHRMGRVKEARQALERAVQEANPRDSSGQMANEALAGLLADLSWRPGRRAPVVTAPDLSGQQQSTSRYRGKVLLIDLWSPWSEELKDRKALYARYRSKGLAILGVGIGRDKEETARFIKAQKVEWPQLVDDTGWRSVIGRQFGYHHSVTQLPRTILVDRRGIIRHVNLHGEALEAAVAELVRSR